MPPLDVFALTSDHVWQHYYCLNQNITCLSYWVNHSLIIHLRYVAQALTADQDMGGQQGLPL